MTKLITSMTPKGHHNNHFWEIQISAYPVKHTHIHLPRGVEWCTSLLLQSTFVTERFIPWSEAPHTPDQLQT